MLNKLTFGVFFIATFFAIGQINTGNPAVPFGSNISYEFGMMPTNLPSSGAYGQSSEAADAYNEFKAGFVENCGSNAARVKFDNQSQTVSEGVAYTMLLAAYAADQDVFNRVWQFYKNHRNANGVMHWKISGCNTVVGFNGATDAEVDAAMALIVADKQWGSSGQAHNYKADAITLIKAIKDHEINTGDKTFENGDAWKPDCRNPSYQAPGYARVWQTFMNENGEDGDFWVDVAVATENLHKVNSGTYPSGLSSNWCQSNGIANSSCSGSGTNWASFGYDACRAPWRQGIDYLWHGNDADGIQGIVNTQINFWRGNGGATQVSGGDSRNQDGSGNGDHVGAFIGMIGAQSLASNATSANQSFVNDMYAENVDVNPNGYFNRVLRCLGLFVQTGNFWNPYTVGGSGNNTSEVTVSFTQPSNAYFVADENILFAASASTTSGNITKVEFSRGSTILKTDNNAPFTYSTSFSDVGSVTITAKAYDESGSTNTASITVNIVPTIPGTSTMPIIDGEIDDVWNSVTAFSIENVISGNVTNSADLTGEFKTMWNEEYLYVLVDVKDNSLRNNSTQLFQDDGIELYLDINNDKPSAPGSNDRQYIIRWNDTQLREGWSDNTNGLTFSEKNTTDGYRQEIRIKWSNVGLSSPSEGVLLGLDVQINDDDNDGDANRDAKIAWAGVTDNTWQDPSLMQTIALGPVSASGCIAPSVAEISSEVLEFCEGESSELTANFVEGYLYQWFKDGTALGSGSVNGNVLIVDEPGSYSVKIADGDLLKASCAILSDAVDITKKDLPLAEIEETTSQSVFCDQTSTGASLMAVSSGSSVSYSWKQGTIEVATGISATLTEGSYTLETTLNGCSNTSEAFEVAILCECTPPTIAEITSVENLICEGESITIQANKLDGYVYQWYRDGSASSSGVNVDSLLVSVSGSYKVRVADGDLNDANCYLESETFDLTVNTIPDAIVVGGLSYTYCEEDQSGALVLAESIGVGVDYSWVNNVSGNVTEGRNATLSEGTYILEVTQNGCKGVSEMVNVVQDCPCVQPDQPNINASMTSFCVGESIVLTTEEVSSALYEWFRDGIALNEVTSEISVSEAGSYVVRIADRDINNTSCYSESVALNVTEKEIPEAILDLENSSTSYCEVLSPNGSTVKAVSQSNGTNYKWITASGELNGISVELKQGTYILQADKDGCSASSEEFTITESCNGLLGDVSVSFVEPQVTEFVLGENVIFNVQVSSTVGSIRDVIFEENGTILRTVSSAPYQFGINSLTLGVHTIKATATNIYGISMSEEITVTIIELPCVKPIDFIVNNGENQGICEGEFIELNVPLNADELYRWYKDDAPLSTSNNLTISEEGTYHLRKANLDLDDEACFTESNRLVVTVNPYPEAQIVTPTQELTYCNGTEGVVLEAKAVDGALYEWNGPVSRGILSSPSTLNSINSVKSGKYRVTVTKNECSSVSNPVTVQELQKPLAELNSDESETEICEGSRGKIALKDAGFGSIYTWSNGLGFGRSKSNLEKGIYEVSVVNGDCENRIQVQVLERQKPVVNEIFGGNEVCLKGGPAKVNLSVEQREGSTYAWRTEVGVITTVDDEHEIEIEIETREEGAVSIVETDIFGCESDEVKREFVYSCPNGLFDASNKINVSVYPNPFNDRIYTTESLDYKFYDVNGILLFKGETSSNGIDLSSVNSGVYNIQLSNESGTAVVKLIKK